MNKKNYLPLNAERKAYILEQIESIESWDNAYHRHLDNDKRESLMVIQSRELRNERLLQLFKFLLNNTSANIAHKDSSAHNQNESPRYNRAALVSTLDLIQHYDQSIKEFEMRADIHSDYSIYEAFYQQRNNQWFFIFDYLFELGGKSVFQGYVSKVELLTAA